MNEALRRRAGDVLGAPVVPPGRATRSLNRMRSLLRGLHRRAAPPPVQILETMFGLVDNRVVGVLCELGVPDNLDQPQSLDDLARTIGADPARLDRILRFAVSRGFLKQDRRGRYRANGFTDRLRHDHPNSWRGWVEFAASPWFWDAWRHLPAALEADGPSGLEAATGMAFFDYVTAHPDAGRTFDSAMEAGAVMQGLSLATTLDWSGIRTVCDVGGGNGAALEVILEGHPSVEGVLFDLPEVVANARPTLRTGELAPRCRLEGGDFFSGVPQGVDRYQLLAVIHDWNDDQAVEILQNVRAAMPPAGDVVIVDWLLPDRPRDDFAFAADVLMLTLADGRERTLAEFDALFGRAGLQTRERAWLASGSCAFTLTAA